MAVLVHSVLVLSVALFVCLNMFVSVSSHNGDRKHKKLGVRRTTTTTTAVSSTTVEPDIIRDHHREVRIIDDDDYSFSSVGDSSVSGPAKCVDIPSNMSLCRGIGYSQMRLPNLLHHQALAEVSQQASSWAPLLATRCHVDAQLFLCSLFSPVCLDQPIWPCRSLCEGVKEGCEARMLVHGFPWPKMLNCERFPSSDDLCISPPTRGHNKSHHIASTSGNMTCSACQRIEDSDTLRETYCTADFVVKIRPEETVLSGSDLKITAVRKTKMYKQPMTSQANRRQQTFFLENAADCDCYDLASFSFNPTGNAAAQYILFGKQDENNEKMTLSYVHKFDPKSIATRRALRSLSRGDLCEGRSNSKSNIKLNLQGEKKRKGSHLGSKHSDKKLKKNQKKNPGGKKPYDVEDDLEEVPRKGRITINKNEGKKDKIRKIKKEEQKRNQKDKQEKFHSGKNDFQRKHKDYTTLV